MLNRFWKTIAKVAVVATATAGSVLLTEAQPAIAGNGNICAYYTTISPGNLSVGSSFSVNLPLLGSVMGAYYNQDAVIGQYGMTTYTVALYQYPTKLTVFVTNTDNHYATIQGWMTMLYQC